MNDYDAYYYEFQYDELSGVWKKIKKAVKKALTPPKSVRKALKKAFTPPKAVREGIARAFTPPKAVRKALTKPKWLRKAIKKNPWLDTVIDAGITAIGFLPVPGAQVVSIGLDVVNEMSDTGAAIDEIHRAARQAAQEEANMYSIAQQQFLMGAIPAGGFPHDVRAQALHDLAIYSGDLTRASDIEAANEARALYDQANVELHMNPPVYTSTDQAVVFMYGDTVAQDLEQQTKEAEQGLTELEKILTGGGSSSPTTTPKNSIGLETTGPKKTSTVTTGGPVPGTVLGIPTNTLLLAGAGLAALYFVYKR